MNTKHRMGFNLIELLVVISILMILAGLMLPSLSGARERGKMANCAANLHGIGQAIIMYVDEHKDQLPWYYNSSTHTSWDTELMPYIGYEEGILLCPSDALGDGTSTNKPRTYAANGGGSGSHPFGGSGTKPLRYGRLGSNRQPLILIGEQPGTNAANRSYVGGEPFSGLAEKAGTVHKNGEGANYLMTGGDVQYFEVNEVEINGDNNPWQWTGQ